MEKYSQITNHIKNGNQLGKNFKISTIVDSKSATNKINNLLPDNMNNHRSSNGHTNHSIITDLIPYPASSISTTIEKGANTDLNDLENSRSYVAKKQVSKSKTKVNDKQSFDKQSSPNHSLESKSVSSSQHILPETKMFFDTDNIVRIIKLLREKKESYTQTESKEKCNQYVQVNVAFDDHDIDDPNKFDLNRSNQTLRSQLDQLSYIIEEMSKERSNTNLQLHSLQKLIKVKELQIEETNAEKEKYLADNDELRFAMKNIETLINDYQKSLLAKNSENDELRKELNINNSDKNNLMSQVAQIKSELQVKEDLIKELYRVNSMNQEEISTLKSHYQSMSEQLNRSSVEMQNLLTYRSMLEQRLLSFSNDPFQSKENQQQNKPFAPDVTSLKSNCLLLRQSLQLTRETFICQYEQFIKEYNSNRSHILGMLHSILKANATNNSEIINKLMEKDVGIRKCESDIDQLTKKNQQLMDEQAKQIEENNSGKEQLFAKLSSIQAENVTLKETNEAFQQKIVSLNNDCLKLRDESIQSFSELDKYRQYINKMESELENVHSQVDQLERRNQEQSFNDQYLRQENERLSNEAFKLKENKSLDNSEQLAVKEELNKCRTNLENLQNRFEMATENLLTEVKAKEEAINEKHQLVIYLKDRKDKIANLNSNISILSRRNRELCDQLNNKTLNDQSCQTTEIIVELEQMQSAITERNTVIASQNEQLAQLTTQSEQDDKLKQEMRTKIDYLNRCLQEKDLQSKTVQENFNASNQPNQMIATLQSDLAKEKERSKGLSQSLFNEKRLNNKFKKELTQIKLSDREAKHSDSSSPKVITTETDFAEFDSSQLSVRLKDKIIEVKELLTEIESRKSICVDSMDTMENGLATSLDTLSTHSIEPSSNTLEKTLASLSQDGHYSLPNDFIIQILKDPSDSTDGATNKSKPLDKLHSSIEDLKQELNSLKQSLTFEDTFQPHSPLH